jgi:CRISPR-associated endonuclease/helicase Cas3
LRKWLSEEYGSFLDMSSETKRFIALVKALVIAADVAGSVVPRYHKEPTNWAEAVLKRICMPEELRSISTAALGDNYIRPFQNRVADSTASLTFVKAGCGSGKTVAAYLWASRQAEGRKLFFCYPTTGTATEGYRDYIIPSEMEADSELLHSRSDADLEDLLHTKDQEIFESPTRVEALAGWDVPLVICTADQVLGLIQNYRRALFSFPCIANAALVFDEIHLYDNRMFGALLRFVDAFRGAPILLMTASLPAARLKSIHDVLQESGRTLEIIEGPPELEQIERYQFQDLCDNPPWDAVHRTLAARGKVLWVANTVDRAVEFAMEARARGIDPVLPYHSRYRYVDRVKKHRNVVDAFRRIRHGPVLAITTQVCEVSLNLSADLLVSELAPIPALIQRLGRLNRWITAEKAGRPKPAIFLEPANALPYEKHELEIARQWLQSLGTAPLSQSDLTLAFEKVAVDDEVLRVESPWLDGGPFSHVAPLREAGVTIPVILNEDVTRCRDAKGRAISREIVRHTIPMTLGPVMNEISRFKMLGFVYIAPKGRIEYSTEWGARWAR